VFGQNLDVQPERDNSSDSHVVATLLNDAMVGHLALQLPFYRFPFSSAWRSHFLRNNW